MRTVIEAMLEKAKTLNPIELNKVANTILPKIYTNINSKEIMKLLERDNIIIEEIQFTEELYQKNLEENEFAEDDAHGIGEDADGNS